MRIAACWSSPGSDSNDAEQLAFTDRLGERVNFTRRVPGSDATAEDVYDTPMLRASPVDVDAYAASMPMKRAGRPEEIAGACAYLASDEAAYVTGQTISVNGGRYLGSA